MGIVGKVSFFISAVAIGIGQGFQPVSAFNFGARKYRRVAKAFRFTVISGTLLLGIMAAVCIAVPAPIVSWFRNDPEVVEVGAGGRASFLAALRAGVCFLPLILILPRIFGIVGIELAQPCADIVSTVISVAVTEVYLAKLKKIPDGQMI